MCKQRVAFPLQVEAPATTAIVLDSPHVDTSDILDMGTSLDNSEQDAAPAPTAEATISITQVNVHVHPVLTAL